MLFFTVSDNNLLICEKLNDDYYILSLSTAAALVLGRKLILSLLANAFLCTFPTTGPQSHITPFNFDKFFNVFLQKE